MGLVSLWDILNGNISFETGELKTQEQLELDKELDREIRECQEWLDAHTFPSIMKGNSMSEPEGESEDHPEGCDDRLSPKHIQALSDNFHVAHMRPCLMPTIAEAKARLAEIERERAQLRAFIRNEERIAKKHPTGHLKGME